MLCGWEMQHWNNAFPITHLYVYIDEIMLYKTLEPNINTIHTYSTSYRASADSWIDWVHLRPSTGPRGRAGCDYFLVGRRLRGRGWFPNTTTVTQRSKLSKPPTKKTKTTLSYGVCAHYLLPFLLFCLLPDTGDVEEE